MNPLWVLKSDCLQVPIGPIHPFWLSLEDNLFHLVKLASLYDFYLRLFNILIDLFLWLFKELVVIKESLLPVESCPRISTLHKLFYQPLENWENLSVVKTLNLMCSDQERTLHFFAGHLNLFRQLNFLTHGKVVLKFNIDIVV